MNSEIRLYKVKLVNIAVFYYVQMSSIYSTFVYVWQQLLWEIIWNIHTRTDVNISGVDGSNAVPGQADVGLSMDFLSVVLRTEWWKDQRSGSQYLSREIKREN